MPRVKSAALPLRCCIWVSIKSLFFEKQQQNKTMAVDYCQRKAAKKQRRRLNDGKKKSNSDGAAGGEGGSSSKDKKSRPKRGRSGPRRLCKGMCFQVPKVSRKGESID